MGKPYNQPSEFMIAEEDLCTWRRPMTPCSISDILSPPEPWSPSMTKEEIATYEDNEPKEESQQSPERRNSDNSVSDMSVSGSDGSEKKEVSAENKALPFAQRCFWNPNESSSSEEYPEKKVTSSKNLESSTLRPKNHWHPDGPVGYNAR